MGRARPVEGEAPAGGPPVPPAEESSAEVAGTVESSAPRQPPEGAPPGQIRLYLNLGRKDGASGEDVGALLTSEGVNLPPAQIEVMNTHTYLNVPAEDAERLCAALTGKERSGRTLACEPARPPRRRGY